MMLVCSGYMSPEYAKLGQFSVKSDVYSFGVLILEILSGKKISSFYESDGAGHLLNYVSKVHHHHICIWGREKSDIVTFTW